MPRSLRMATSGAYQSGGRRSPRAAARSRWLRRSQARWLDRSVALSRTPALVCFIARARSRRPLRGAPQRVEALGELRRQRLVLVLEIDIGALERLRREAVGPGAQVPVVVAGPPQTEVRVIRRADERRRAGVALGDAQRRGAGAHRLVDFVV